MTGEHQTDNETPKDLLDELKPAPNPLAAEICLLCGGSGEFHKVVCIDCEGTGKITVVIEKAPPHP